MSINIINNDNDDIDDKEDKEEKQENEIKDNNDNNANKEDKNDKNEPLVTADSKEEDENKCIRAIQIISGIILIILGIITGISLGVIIVLIVAEKTKNAMIAYVIQFLVMLFIIGGFTYISICTMGVRHKKSIITGIIIFFIIWAMTFAFLLCMFHLPVKNDNKFYEIESFWNLNSKVKISYIKYGNASIDNPIIFLHGGPGEPLNGKENFLENIASEGYEIYQYDQFGCGNSDHAKDPKEYTIERQVSDLEEIRQIIKAEKINLISHSWGGTLALNYMEKYNDKVANSIFISPGPIWGDDNSHEKITKEGKKEIDSTLKKNLRFYFSQILTSLLSETGLFYLMSEKKLDNLFMNFHDKLNMKPGSGQIYNIKAAGYGFWVNQMISESMPKEKNIYKNLAKSEAKSLIIKGQYDYFSWENTILYKNKINNSSLILAKGMGHSIEKDYEKYISQNIIYFLNEGKPLNETYNEEKNPWE